MAHLDQRTKNALYILFACKRIYNSFNDIQTQPIFSTLLKWFYQSSSAKMMQHDAKKIGWVGYLLNENWMENNNLFFHSVAGCTKTNCDYLFHFSVQYVYSFLLSFYLHYLVRLLNTLTFSSQVDCKFQQPMTVLLPQDIKMWCMCWMQYIWMEWNAVAATCSIS